MTERTWGSAFRKQFTFNPGDRATIQGADYCVLASLGGRHSMRLVAGLVPQDYYIAPTDPELATVEDAGQLRIEEGFYSAPAVLRRVRGEPADPDDLSDLDKEAMLGMRWRLRWCIEFDFYAKEQAAAGTAVRNIPAMDRFARENWRRIHEAFALEHGVHRPLGRRLPGRKLCDYPAGRTLRTWLKIWSGRRHDNDLAVFRPGYARCGNRKQVDPRAEEIVERCKRSYLSLKRPFMSQVYLSVLAEIRETNEKNPDDKPIHISGAALRRRLADLRPFHLLLAREGADKAIRAYTGVGAGLGRLRLLERVEVDDWEADLLAIVGTARAAKRLSRALRRQLKLIRCTVTVGVDCASHAVVALNVSINSPSTATSVAALRSATRPKDRLAKWAGARRDWPMGGRMRTVAADAGVAFGPDFDEVLRRLRVNRVLPEADPRMRGTIESFFGSLRKVCRYFGGQVFSNIIERGDYPAEKLAELTVEELTKKIVKFIVDIYHSGEHRGLRGGTPYEAWRALAGSAPPAWPSDREVMCAFGAHSKRSIDKNGIVMLTLPYNNAALSALHRVVGDQEVDCVLDPGDLTDILVRVPREHQAEIPDRQGDYIVVRCLDERAHGRTLAELFEHDEAVRRLAKEQADAGRPFLIAGHRDLLDDGERARVEAGLPSHELTMRELDRAVRAIERKEQAAFGSALRVPRPGKGAPRGEVVASTGRAAPPPVGPRPEYDDEGIDDV